MPADLATVCVQRQISIRGAIAQIDANRNGIVLIIDQDRRLLGTVTDGDVRRAILADISLDEPVGLLLDNKLGSDYENPITVLEGQTRESMLHTLQQNGILHLPVIDREQRVVDLVTLQDLLPEEDMGLHAVIMAGGQGTRLRPLTDDLPKPMLSVGDRPLMELTIEQLKDAGIKNVNITLHHKLEKITGHFGDGTGFGVNISYVTEERPLGTAGALGLMNEPEETLLVINGDILTQVDFRAMLTYHREHNADLTLAVSQHSTQVAYGVIECEDTWVKSVVEKPVYKSLINAGIYLLEPGVFRFIPKGQPFDMTELIQTLLNEDQGVAAFPIHEYWLDIGQPEDYQQAKERLAS